MSKPFIFYGAGEYAKKNLALWIAKGIIPVCFSDSDPNSHYTKVAPSRASKSEFDILSFEEAIQRYPDADVCVTINTEADAEAHQDIRDSIVKRGFPRERIREVPENPTDKEYIFYGAGIYAIQNIVKWTSSGIKLVCFADSNKQKQNTKMKLPKLADRQFDVLPIQEALERYPDAFI